MTKKYHSLEAFAHQQQDSALADEIENAYQSALADIPNLISRTRANPRAVYSNQRLQHVLSGLVDAERRNLNVALLENARALAEIILTLADNQGYRDAIEDREMNAQMRQWEDQGPSSSHADYPYPI